MKQSTVEVSIKMKKNTEKMFRRLVRAAEPYYPSNADVESIMLEQILNNCLENRLTEEISYTTNIYEVTIPYLIKNLKEENPNLSPFELLQLYLLRKRNVA